MNGANNESNIKICLNALGKAYSCEEIRIDQITKPQVAYITNYGVNTVSICNVTSGMLSECTTKDGFDEPEGIAINSAGTFAYITSEGDQTVSVCAISSSTRKLEDCSHLQEVISINLSLLHCILQELLHTLVMKTMGLLSVTLMQELGHLAAVK